MRIMDLDDLFPSLSFIQHTLCLLLAGYKDVIGNETCKAKYEEKV